MLHLRSFTVNRAHWRADEFPFNVPALRQLDGLEFTTPVTFLIGENGSGKSTLLEALASAAGSISVGSDDVQSDATLDAVRQLAHALKLVWSKRTRRGFFMRSEDFFGYARRMMQVKADLLREYRSIDHEYADRSDHAKNLARMPYAQELNALKESYGQDLDSYSHGESFFQLFRARFKPDGLYLLDEPEAPLSPLRQMALLSMLHDMVTQQNAQFIIATHSPIIMAYPGATILSFDGGTVKPIAYEDTEHVRITRSFLNSPESYLRHLLEP